MRTGWLIMPCWVVFLIAGVPPLLWAVERKRRRRNAELVCASCGYDLRATPDRCPECGAVPAEYRTGEVSAGLRIAIRIKHFAQLAVCIVGTIFFHCVVVLLVVVDVRQGAMLRPAILVGGEILAITSCVLIVRSVLKKRGRR